MLATTLFFKGNNTDADRTWSRKVCGSLCRSKMQGSWPFGSIVFASKSTPGVKVPSLRFSFRDHLSLVGRRKYRSYALSLSVCAAHQSPTRVFFSSGLSGESAPVWVHRQRLAFAASVRSKKRRKRRIRRRRFEGGRRKGASSKDEESSKEPVQCSTLTRG